MTDYERGYKDGMAGAALPNVIDSGDKIDGYAYSYKTDSEGVPYINIDCVRNMLNKAADVQPVKQGQWIHDRRNQWKCSNCGNFLDFDGLNCGRGSAFFCPNCGARMDDAK